MKFETNIKTLTWLQVLLFTKIEDVQKNEKKTINYLTED